MARRDDWRKVYERFDPEQPASAEWRVERARSPANELAERLDAPLGTPRYLFRGTVGTGKTTELLRLAENRAGDDLVVVLDLVRHFGEVVADLPALARVTSWEVTFLAGAALMRAAEDRWGHAWATARIDNLANHWTKLAKKSGSKPPAKLDVAKLARSMVLFASASAEAGATAGGLKLLEAVAGASSWSIPIGIGGRPIPDQSSDVQGLLAAVNAMVGDVHREYSRRVLFVIDGLDRISDIERARALFVESDLLSRISAAQVVAAPFALRHHPSVSSVRGYRDSTLVNEPVLDKADPARHGSGVEFFCALYARRTGDLPRDLIPRDQLEKLAYYSGGRARDFVKSVQMVAERCYVDDKTEADDAALDAALDEARTLLETGLHRGHLDLLQQVADDPDHELPEDEAVWMLLEERRLLPFPNDSEWFFPHPLLTRTKIKLTPPGSSV